MPKRIMSARKNPSKNKRENKIEGKKLVFEEEDKKEEAPVPKKKDRSALIGLKRTRKSRDQIFQLQKCYEDSRGKPTKAQLKQLAKDTGLKL